jgi:hypothetical protein
MAFLEHLAVVGRVGVVEELLWPRAPHPTGDQPAPRDQVDHGQFLGQAQRVAVGRDRVADQDDPDPLGDPGQHRCLHVEHRAHAERVAMMLIERDAVEADLLGQHRLVEIGVIVIRAQLGVERRIGIAEVGSMLVDLIFCQTAIGPLGDVVKLHSALLQGEPDSCEGMMFGRTSVRQTVLREIRTRA